MTKNILPRKVFTVLIGEKEYDVYDIEGKEHPGYNGEVKTWWLYYSDRLPGDLTPPVDSEYWKPYVSGCERHVWDIRFKQRNSTKDKWGETQFRSSTWVEMWCNGRLIYQFGTSGGRFGLSFAMAKAQHLQVVMSEHPYNFFEPEKENGRKIYWRGLPATIKNSSYPGEIHIIPEYSDELPKEAWWNELERRESCIGKLPDDFDEIEKEHREEHRCDDFINWGDALSDQHINWFRK